MRDFTLTKKHLGWILLLGGIFGFFAVFSIDVITIIRGPNPLFSAETLAYLRSPLGIGPAQRLALAGCVGVALVGVSLIPLGDRPA